MTSSFALPILLDPRVNNIPFVMGLTQENYTIFETELHELHFQWYVKVHATRLKKRELLAPQQRPGSSVDEAHKNDDTVKVEVDMGWDNFRRQSRSDQSAPSIEPTDYMCTTEPMARSAFFEKSKAQYDAYLDACSDFPWAATFPNAQVGVPGVKWQIGLAEENLTPVMLALSMQSQNGSLGFFVQLALHSTASMFKMPASSFVERVNSAGKIVYNERNVKMLPGKVEQRVLLRMNRAWMIHMRATYPELTTRLEKYTRAASEALNHVYQEECPFL